jgi:hypothetical protein
VIENALSWSWNYFSAINIRLNVVGLRWRKRVKAWSNDADDEKPHWFAISLIDMLEHPSKWMAHINRTVRNKVEILMPAAERIVRQACSVDIPSALAIA